MVSKCPLIVALDVGGYFLSSLLVSPGIGGRYPLSSAVWRVEIAGEKSEAWANATSSGAVALWLIAVCDWCIVLSWRVQSPLVLWLRSPLRSTLSL